MRWEIQLNHVYREGNRVANSLEKQAATLPYREVERWSYPPASTDDIYCWSITHSKQRLYNLHKYNTPCKIANSKLQINK